MARRGQAWGIVRLLVAMAAMLACGPPARAAGGPPAGASAGTAAAIPPTRGPGANFDRQAYAQGLREAPAILARAAVACTVQQAVFEGESSLLNAHGDTVGRARLYEVACAEGLGYFLNVRGKDVVFAEDCIAAGEAGKAACMLPLNSHPAGGLEPSLKAAGVPCGAARARYLGQNLETRLRRYEVRCRSGGGYLLDMPLADGSGAPPRATPCFEAESECQLISHIENVAALAFKVGKRFGESCQIGDARYVGYVAAHDHELYEVSCQAGRDGELIEIDHAGVLAKITECASVRLVGAACQLKSGAPVDPGIVESQSAGAEGAVITAPDWLRRPNAHDFAELYPLAAVRAGVSGRAMIGCRVLASGLLTACLVIDESPAQFGFGAAAVKMARAFQMTPMTRDGKLVAGGEVDIPINFSIRPR